MEVDKMARRRGPRGSNGRNQDEGIDWRRTIFIVFGVLIVLSMALSLIAPMLGGGGAGF